MKTIREYCEEKEITVQELHNITGVSYSLLNKGKDDNDLLIENIRLQTVLKIWNGTKDRFGEDEALDIWQYIRTKHYAK